MSSKLIQCREGLAKALGQSEHLLQINSRSAAAFFYIPHPQFTQHCLTLTNPNPNLINHCQQGSEEDFTVSDSVYADSPALLGSPDGWTLGDPIVKLEFENKCNQMCSRFSLNVQGNSTGRADDSVEQMKDGSNGEKDEEDVRLINMILDMEQDYKLFVY